MAVRTAGMISALLASCSSCCGGDQGAVGGAAVADLLDQVVGVDGDDHRGRDAAGVGDVAGAELPVAQIFERVVLPLPVGAFVDGSGRVDAGFGQRVEQGFEFGAGRPGEPEVPDIGPVPGRRQVQIAAVGR